MRECPPRRCAGLAKNSYETVYRRRSQCLTAVSAANPAQNPALARRLGAYRDGQNWRPKALSSVAAEWPGGVAYATILTDFTAEMAELEGMGVQLKDFDRGLIDFPSLRDGRVVLLCWQLGEGDELEWWHDMDAGFGGRTPL